MGLQEHTTTLNSGGDPDHFRTACLGGLNHSASVTPMSRAEGSLQAKFGPWELYGRDIQHTPDVAMQQLDLCTQGSLLFQKSFTIFFTRVFMWVHVPLCRGQKESFRSWSFPSILLRQGLSCFCHATYSMGSRDRTQAVRLL